MAYQDERRCIICEEPYIAHAPQAQVCSHPCHLERRKRWHKKNGDKIRAKDRARYHNGGKEYYRRYEKTPKGFLMRLYRNMQSRTCGIQKKKYHLYKGKTLLPRDDFYRWAENSEVFWSLFSKWKESKYDRKLTPTVDRTDPKKGYEVDNMEWVTHSENSRRGSLSRHKKMKI